jgi:hypothetical protein
MSGSKATEGLEPISYREVLVSTLLHATVYMFLHNLLNVLVQIANKMGLQNKLPIPFFCIATGCGIDGPVSISVTAIFIFTASKPTLEPT